MINLYIRVVTKEPAIEVYEALLLSCLLPFRYCALIDIVIDGKFNIAMSHLTKVICYYMFDLLALVHFLLAKVRF
jgi:hypothetical protein